MRINIGENGRMAITTLRENKMRSFLTVLGVVIGITALLSVVSILVGVYSNVNDYLTDYGPETLFIFRFDPGIHTGRLTSEERARKPLTLEDAEAIEQFCRRCVLSRSVSIHALWRKALRAGPSRRGTSAKKSLELITTGHFPPPKKYSIPGRASDASSARVKTRTAQMWR